MSSRKPEPPIPTIPSGYVRMSSRQGTTRRVSRPPSPALHQYPPQSPLYHDASQRPSEGQAMLNQRNLPNASFVPSTHEPQPRQESSAYAHPDQYGYDQDPRGYPRFTQSQPRGPYVESDAMNGGPSSRPLYPDYHQHQQYPPQPPRQPQYQQQLQQRPPSGAPSHPSHSSHPPHLAQPSHPHHPSHSHPLPSSTAPSPSPYPLHDIGRPPLPHQHSEPLPNHPHHPEQPEQPHHHHHHLSYEQQQQQQLRHPQSQHPQHPQHLQQQQQQRARGQPQLYSSRPATPVYTGASTHAHAPTHAPTHAHTPAHARARGHASPAVNTRDTGDRDEGSRVGAGAGAVSTGRGGSGVGSGSGSGSGAGMPHTIVSKSHFIRHRAAAHPTGSILQPYSTPTQPINADMKGSGSVNVEGRVERRPTGKTGVNGGVRAGGRGVVTDGGMEGVAMPPPGALRHDNTSSTSSSTSSSASAALSSASTSTPLPASVTSLLTEYDRLLHLFHSRTAADTTTTTTNTTTNTTPASASTGAGMVGADGEGEGEGEAEVEEVGSSKLFGTRGLRRSTTRRGTGTGTGTGSDEAGEGLSADAAVKALVAKLYRQVRVQRGACEEMRTALSTVRGACESAARDAARGAWGAREKKDRESEEIFRKLHGCVVEAAEVCREHQVEREVEQEIGREEMDGDGDGEEGNAGDDVSDGYTSAGAGKGTGVTGRPGSAWGEGNARPTSRGTAAARDSQQSSDKVAAVRAQLMFLLAQRDRTIASLEVRVEELLRERDARPRVDATLGLRGDVTGAHGSSTSGGSGSGGGSAGDVVVGGGSGELGLPAPILAQFYEQYAHLRSEIQNKLNERVSHLLLSSRVPRQALHLINTLHYGLVHEVAAHTTTKAVYNARLLQLERLAREREVDVRLGRMREEALEQALRERDAVIRKAEKSLFMTLQRQKTHSSGPGASGSGQ